MDLRQTDPEWYGFGLIDDETIERVRSEVFIVRFSGMSHYQECQWVNNVLAAREVWLQNGCTLESAWSDVKKVMDEVMAEERNERYHEAFSATCSRIKRVFMREPL